MSLVSIIDDDQPLCDLLEANVARRHGVSVFHSGLEAIQRMPPLVPDVVVLDACQEARLHGFACLRHLQARGLPSRIIVITGCQQFELIAQARRHGAHAFLSMPFALVTLVDVVDMLLSNPQGELAGSAGPAPSAATRPAPAANPPCLLSATEIKVLTALRTYPRAKELSQHLGMTQRTVPNHLFNIYRKLGVHCRNDALVKYFGAAFMSRRPS